MGTDWTNQLILGRFRVDLRLAGVSESYRAWDMQLSRPVTLHFLPDLPGIEASHQFEVRAHEVERVAHPGILPYLGFFELPQQAFWVEGYVDGPTLRNVLDSTPEHRLPLGEALTYLKALSSALAALHAQGWAHGGLYPENIRLGRNGAIFLAGLFTARRLGEAAPMAARSITDFAPTPRTTPADSAPAPATNTPADATAQPIERTDPIPPPAEPALPPAARYAAPDATISPATDVYALARTLFELLAGTLPEPLPDLRELNPEIPEFLARMLPRGLEPNPAKRIANAPEFFLTVCLACRLEAGSIEERIHGEAANPATSPTGALLGKWPYLPPIEPPRPTTSTLNRDKKRSLAWLWPLVAIGGLGVALMGWYWLRAAPPPQEPVAPLVSSASPLPTAIPVTLAPIAAPTDTLVPTLDAPDGLGGHIVFTCTRTELNHLCLIPPNGGQVFQLTAERAHDYYASFSPDGGMVLYASNRAGMFNLFKKLISTGVLVQLTFDIGEVSSASFSPDGSQIVFSNSVGGAPSDLWIMDKDGKDPRLLYDGAGNIASPVFAPNGKSVAFAMSTPEALETYDVYIWDFETQTVGAVTKGRLPNAGGSVDWSPDGRTLLLFAGPAGDHDIFTFDIVSGKTRQLTDGGNNAAPAWSPDGRWIVFNSQRVNETANIFIMKPDGSDVRQLTNDTEPNWQPRWGR